MRACVKKSNLGSNFADPAFPGIYADFPSPVAVEENSSEFNSSYLTKLYGGCQ